MVDARQGDNRPARYEELIPGTSLSRVVYRASALGGACTYELAQMREGLTGEPPPGWMMEKFEQGHTLEPRLRELLQVPASRAGLLHKGLTDKAGAQYMCHLETGFSQDELELELMSDNGSGQIVVVRGHVDDAGHVSRIGGTQTLVNVPCIVEYKALGKDFYNQFVKQGITFKTGYAWQASVYGYGANAMYAGDPDMRHVWTPVLFICGLKNPEGTEIIDWHCQYLDEPPVSLAMMKARVRMIESGKVTGCSTAHFPCSMYRFDGNLCNKDTRAELKAIAEAASPVRDVMTFDEDARKEMYMLRDQYERAKAVEKDAKTAVAIAEADRKDIEQMLYRWLDEHGALEAGVSMEIDGKRWAFEWAHTEEVPVAATTRRARDYLKVTAPKERAPSKTPGSQPGSDPFDGLTGGA